MSAIPAAPARSGLDSELETRLCRYCAISTQSDEDAGGAPSTQRQLDLSRLLLRELEEIGAEEVRLTDYGVVLATIPGSRADAPVIGLLAHVDTAPAFSGEGVRPRVLRGWNGGDISYPDDPALRLSPATSPYLAGKIGHDIVTASGTTLLGGDDKAGVAIIMTAARQLLADSSRPHGKIRIAFTPDEEIGRGVAPQLPADLGADFAYTLDGGGAGQLDYESFSADAALVTIRGVSTHTASAKGKMVNALHLAARITASLPQATLSPEVTEGREGFIHLDEVTGSVAETKMKFILRDFELEGLAAKGALLKQLCEAVAAAEPRAQISVEIRKQYRNMRYWLEKDMTPVELARAAIRANGIEPLEEPIRGGTDGSRLTEMGVPCPNLFTGMQDIHGPLEWISVQDMALATRVVLDLVARAGRSASA